MNDASQNIDTYIAEQTPWQAQNLTAFRQLLHSVNSNIQEEWKWSVPVFTLNGKLVCAMSSFAHHTKYNFFDGALLNDPDHIFNSGLDSKKQRSINLKETELIDMNKLKAMILNAVKNAHS